MDKLAKMDEAKCPLCDQPANSLIARWFDYDTEDQYIAWVCKKCIDQHDKAQVQK